MFPEWTWLVGLMIGAAIGSFLNVVIYRMPLGLSLSEPKNSFCPSCKKQLGVPDLVPLFSWLVLRGRCRQCKAKIPSRYFFVELFTGGLWAAFWYQHLIAGWDPARGIALMLFSAALVAAIFIDLKWFIIPDQVNAFMWIVGIGYNGVLFAQHQDTALTWGIPSALAGWLVGVGALWAVTFLGRILFGKDAMGHGDIKMARGIGAVLFPISALMSFAMAVALGAVLGAVQILVRARTDSKHGDGGEQEEDEDDQNYRPESIGSIVKCGIGYVLCFDIIGLFIPKFYESWFGENPYAVESVEEESEVETTMIPFGPYLALGAIAAALFEGPLRAVVSSYWQWATGERPH